MKKFILFFCSLLLFYSCVSSEIDTIKKIELTRNFKYNLMTITNVEDLVAGLILESGELGDINTIKKNMKWKIEVEEKEHKLILVKYKNSKVRIPILQINNNILVEIDDIECVGMNIMGENKYVYPRDIGY
ncbi:MAG: hypothetical protein SPH94_03720 [Fusobacterium necrophorum]|nr:hypothetical protein [Fusobacterium necrophorum]